MLSNCSMPHGMLPILCHVLFLVLYIYLYCYLKIGSAFAPFKQGGVKVESKDIPACYGSVYEIAVTIRLLKVYISVVSAFCASKQPRYSPTPSLLPPPAKPRVKGVGKLDTVVLRSQGVRH